MLVSHCWLSSGLALSVSIDAHAAAYQRDPRSTRPCGHRVGIPRCLPPDHQEPCPSHRLHSECTHGKPILFYGLSANRDVAFLYFLKILKNI